jgi:diguanylate cyclase (GGDEF)-like protein/putative nucleotidyltransferase with HDIG domain
MNSYAVIQFLTLIVYFILIAMVLRQKRTKLINIFVIYLLASMTWSLSSFLNHADFALSQRLLWSKVTPFAALWSIIAYAHFICTFLSTNSRRVAFLGYGLLSIVVVLISLGYIPRSVQNLGVTNVYNDYGPWLYLLTLGGACFIGTALFSLIKSYRKSRSPEHRNRILYLLIGVSFLIIFGVLFEILPQQKYALDHIGHLGNAVLITYAILRYKLFDIKLVVRKGLVYSGISAFITAAYLFVILILYRISENWAGGVGLIPIFALSLLMAWFFNPIRLFIEKGVDRLFYGKRYDYRETVLSLIRRMTDVLDLKELANAMLKPIIGAVRANQGSLLLPQENEFVTAYAEGQVDGEPVIPIKIRNDSPIVTWLIRENKALLKETIDLNIEFKSLWEVERQALESSGVDCFCPIINKNKLIGILALTKKQGRGFYSKDDIDLLMMTTTEAAIAIENAQLYAQARERASIDELTGLYNHRSFHERLDGEIARCSRFGDIFSILMLDLDFFKTYNDIHGHLAGDEILRQLGQQIKRLTRNIDVGFRYGGDEFAMILPRTPLDSAQKVAGRVRKGMEDQMNSQGIELTCSIGVGSWPTDGVMREDLIRVTDAALYYAKQKGRNRICLANEVVADKVLGKRASSENSSIILSTIYALAATVDAKDHYTYGHSKKVTGYAVEVAEALGYTQERVDSIRAAALLHDIGKIGISDMVLQKTGPLTDDDWKPIRAHPETGVVILKRVDSLKDCLAAVLYHHERYDGNGYPAGLKGESIPLDARILAVADAYDAMTSERPYRHDKFSNEQALEELQRCAGTQFDPDIVKVFIKLRKQTSPFEASTKPLLVSGQKLDR